MALASTLSAEPVNESLDNAGATTEYRIDNSYLTQTRAGAGAPSLMIARKSEVPRKAFGDGARALLNLIGARAKLADKSVPERCATVGAAARLNGIMAGLPLVHLFAGDDRNMVSSHRKSLKIHSYANSMHRAPSPNRP